MAWLWNQIDQLHFDIKQKRNLFLMINTVFAAIVGLLLWCIVRNFCLPTLDWAICFAGYPGMFWGLLGGTIFLGNHS